MNDTEPLVGKEAYKAVIQRFYRVYRTMRVEEMIIQGNHACVIGNYDLRFPNGSEMLGNVAEIWTSEVGKLQSLRIYFDTHMFAINSK